MAVDPTKYADWEIAEEAESRMKTVPARRRDGPRKRRASSLWSLYCQN